MKITIKTTDRKVKSILENELMGQFSDGFWENNRTQLWRELGDVVLTEDENGLEGPNYKVERAINSMYNVENRELLKYIGARMTGFVAFADLIEENDVSDLRSLINYTAESAWNEDGFEKRITSYKPVKVTIEDVNKAVARMTWKNKEELAEAASVLKDYITKNEVILDVKELRETFKKTNKVLRTTL